RTARARRSRSPSRARCASPGEARPRPTTRSPPLCAAPGPALRAGESTDRKRASSPHANPGAKSRRRARRALLDLHLRPSRAKLGQDLPRFAQSLVGALERGTVDAIDHEQIVLQEALRQIAGIEIQS